MLKIVRSGVVYVDYGSLRDFGRYGHDWSRSISTYSSPTSANAYLLYFNPSDVAPSLGPYNRWLGFPVRCLVILVNLELLLFPNTDCHKVEKALI